MIYYDGNGKLATIEDKMLYPYKKADKKQKSFVLSVFSGYNDNFLIYRSVYETEQAAVEGLMEFSYGKWELIYE